MTQEIARVDWDVDGYKIRGRGVGDQRKRGYKEYGEILRTFGHLRSVFGSSPYSYTDTIVTH